MMHSTAGASASKAGRVDEKQTNTPTNLQSKFSIFANLDYV